MDVLELSAKVAGGAVGATLTAHGVPGTGPAVEALLTSLLGIQEEQAAAVERIDAAVQRLVDGPWRTAGLLIGRPGCRIEQPRKFGATSKKRRPSCAMRFHCRKRVSGGPMSAWTFRLCYTCSAMHPAPRCTHAKR